MNFRIYCSQNGCSLAEPHHHCSKCDFIYKSVQQSSYGSYNEYGDYIPPCPDIYVDYHFHCMVDPENLDCQRTDYHNHCGRCGQALSPTDFHQHCKHENCERVDRHQHRTCKTCHHTYIIGEEYHKHCKREKCDRLDQHTHCKKCHQTFSKEQSHFHCSQKDCTIVTKHKHCEICQHLIQPTEYHKHCVGCDRTDSHHHCLKCRKIYTTKKHTCTHIETSNKSEK